MLDDALKKEWYEESKLVARNLMVKVLVKKGDYVAAKEKWDEARKEHGMKNPQTYNNWVECLLEASDAAVNLIKQHEPLTICQRALSFDEQNAYTLAVYGRAMERWGDKQQGANLIQRAGNLGFYSIPNPAAWGDYAVLCRQFAEKVKQLSGVTAVVAKHHGDYVDVWVMTQEDKHWELTRPALEMLDEVWDNFPTLLLDFMVTDGDPPDDFIVFYSQR